jgi:hypothetical protein
MLSSDTNSMSQWGSVFKNSKCFCIEVNCKESHTYCKIMTFIQQMHAECDQPHTYILIHQTTSIQDIQCKSDLRDSSRKKIYTDNETKRTSLQVCNTDCVVNDCLSKSLIPIHIQIRQKYCCLSITATWCKKIAINGRYRKRHMNKYT